MPSSYTSSLRLTLPATGELAGAWGNTVNTGITDLVDASVAGTTTISTWGGAGVAYTLTNNNGAADEARRMFIVATGAPGEAKNVICPAVSKFYVFRNNTTGGFALTLKTSAGTGIAVPAGQSRFLYCDGTNVVEMVNSIGGLSVGALTSGRVTYAGTSGLLQDSANLTFNGTTLTAAGFSGPFNGTVGATTANTGAFTTLSASGAFSLTGDQVQVSEGGTGATTAATARVNLGVITATTGSAILPAGTTAQRDGTPVAGYIRFNSTISQFEGYNGSVWSSVGGGATGGGADQVFVENGRTVTTNYTLTTGKNAMSTGPITVNSGVTVTVPSGARWVVI